MNTRQSAIEELNEILNQVNDGPLTDSPLFRLMSEDVSDTCLGLDLAMHLCHGLAARSGWWTSRLTGKPLDYTQVNIGEKLMLIVSEVAEGMEGHRKDLMDDKLPHRKMLEVELADALIRIFDLAGFLQMDLAGAVIEKLAFNQQRPDHKIENRNAPGGKAY